MNIVDYFARNVKYLRLQKGLKQAEICAATGFSTSTWSEYELGFSKPRFDDLLKISGYFGISLSELVEIDLSKGSLNEFQEIRKIIEKGNAKGSVTGSPKIEIAQKGQEKENDDTEVLIQLEQMQKQIDMMRERLMK